MFTRVFKRTMSSTHEQLPRCIKPTYYKLHCWDISNESFKGKVDIQFDVKSPTREIQLNQKLLKFHDAFLSINGASKEVESISKDDKNETVSFKLQDEIVMGQKVSISINYEGTIRNDMAGFYSSSYLNDNGKKEYILATQFESTDARSAIPCYDEPNSKAIFDIKITVKEDFQVLSNMPIKTTKKNQGDITFEFDSTPKMSTYLVAWAIGKFEYVETESLKEYNGSKLPIRVYTIPGKSQTGEYALEVAQKAVDHLSIIFDIDYPLPKLDLLAVPQFGANAMENWGLVMFRSTALLFDPLKSNLLYQKQVSYVVCHEIAHSWFGNLCTMDWWSDLWLNESFATYVGWICVDHIHPDWEVFTDFVSDSVQDSLDLDSLKNSHPVEVQVYYANEIDEIFDAISYKKGGSIVRMVAECVGVELFLKGVSNYLKEHSYSNAKSDDLWNSISKISNLPITKLVEPWIRKVGYPYLKIEKINEDEIKVTQSRFISNGDVQANDDETIWWIPNVDNMTTKEKIIPAKGFLKLNENTNGFYRCQYDDILFDEIISNMDKLSATDKIGLIGDSFSMAQGKIGKTTQFLKLLSELKYESNESVWLEMSNRLNSLKAVYFSDKELSQSLNKFSQELYEGKFQEIMKKPSDKLTFGELKLKSMLFQNSGMSGSPNAIKLAKELYESLEIEPILKPIVFKILLSNEPNDEIFEKVFNEILNPTSIDGREVSLDSIGSISQIKYLPKIFDLLINKQIPEMDYKFLTMSLSKNPVCKLKFWEFIKLHFDSKIHPNTSIWTLDRVIKGFLPNLISKELFEDIDKFFRERSTKGYSKGVLQSLDSISTSVSWYESSRDELKMFFKK